MLPEQSHGMYKIPFLFFAFTSLFLVTNFVTHAQPKGFNSWQIEGQLVDSTNLTPIPGATVAVYTMRDNAYVHATITDMEGNFNLKIPKTKGLKLTISYVGYLNYTKILFDTSSSNLALGKILLRPNTKELQEVEITAVKPIIEQKADRVVYNVDSDISAKGSDASEVLRKAPMVSVDLDGNVSMKGSQNIKLLINGKPSNLGAGGLADALKQIPGDQIQTIEVITSPSAKYDGEGAAGVINIVLKSGVIRGYALNLDAGLGFRSSNLGLMANLKTKKMRFGLGGYGRAGYNIPGKFTNEQFATTSQGNTLYTNQTANTQNGMSFGNFSFTWDYDISKQWLFSAGLKYSTRNSLIQQNDFYTTSFLDSKKLASSLRSTDTKDLSGTWDGNFSLTKSFNKPKQELSLLGLASYNAREFNLVNEKRDTTFGNITSRLRNLNPSTNVESSIQLDYAHPIGENNLLEIGAKQIVRQVKSQFDYATAPGNNLEYTTLANNNLSSSFSYDQNVTGVYASNTYSFLKNYNLRAGLRYEYTTIKGTFSENQLNLPSYHAFLPNLLLSRSFAKGGMLKISYARRLQRPSIQFLNPNIQASNPLNIIYGNPNLQPEYTNNFELSYGNQFKSVFLSATAFVRQTTGAIQTVRSSRGDTISSTYANIGSEDAYGLNLSFNISVSNALTLNFSPEAYWVLLKNNVNNPQFNAYNEGLVYSGRGMASWLMGKGWSSQLFMMYRARQVQVQGYQGSFGVYGLTIKKDIWKKVASLGFGIENFLLPYITIQNKAESYHFSQNSTNTMYNFNAKITLSINLGKTTVEEPRKEAKSLKNEDLKELQDQNIDSGSGGSGGGGGNLRGNRGTKPQ